MFLFISVILCLKPENKPKKDGAGLVVDDNADDDGGNFDRVRDFDDADRRWDDDDFGLPFNDKDPNGPCAPNAIRDNGKCICLEGYNNGHPYTEQGCYRCTQCSKYADCIGQDNCKCYFTHQGNGSYCESNSPIILAFNELKGNILNVTVDFKGDQKLYNGSCIVNNYNIEPIDISSSYIVCPLNRFLPATSQIIIQMNGLKSEASVFRRLKGAEVPKAGQWLTLVSFIIVMVFVTIGLKASSSKKKNDMEPLISKDGQSIGRRLDI